jgi:hypothetical protein
MFTTILLRDLWTHDFSLLKRIFHHLWPFSLCVPLNHDLAVTPSVKWLLLANLANCCRSWSRILSTSGNNVLECSKTPFWKHWKQNSLTYFAPKDQTRTKRTRVYYMFQDQTYILFISRQTSLWVSWLFLYFHSMNIVTIVSLDMRSRSQWKGIINIHRYIQIKQRDLRESMKR